MQVLRTLLLGVVCGLFVVVVVVGLGWSNASGLGEITSALNSAESEVRGSIFPAVAGILAAIMLIGVAASAARVMSRGG